MWGQINGVTKIEIARTTVTDLVEHWNPENPLGLIAYGHNRKGDCDDIETLIPIGPLDKAAYLRSVTSLNPKGMTPLSAAVIKAAEALKSTEQKATVILISDGEETCKLDPCAVGKELEAAGVDFTAHVIGFDVPNPEHQAQLRCLAENTGGQYFNARDSQELSNALSAVVAASTEPPPPPAKASLEAVASAPIASLIDVTWEGPAGQGDYISIVKSGQTLELSYAYVQADANPKQVQISTPPEVGDYLLHYVSPRRAPPILATRSLKVTEVAASLLAPEQVSTGSKIKIHAEGPHNSGSWVGIAIAGSDLSSYITFSYTKGPVTELELQSPSTPGNYEIRYILPKATSALVTRPLKVIESDIAMSGPSEVMGASQLTVSAKAPEGRHWVSIASVGAPPSDYLSYSYITAEQTEYNLTSPLKAGDYELRLIMVGPARIALRQPIKVLSAQASFQAPASVPAGQSFTFSATGPNAPNSWIGLVLPSSPDANYDIYTDLTSDGQYILTAPTTPGTYQLRYVVPRDQVIARQ